jgi:hypothetical protein
MKKAIYGWLFSLLIIKELKFSYQLLRIYILCILCKIYLLIHLNLINF